MIATFGNCLNNNKTYNPIDTKRNVSIGNMNQGAFAYNMNNQDINISSLHSSKEIMGKNISNANDEMQMK